MEIFLVGLGAASLAAWLVLLFLRGGFWRAGSRLESRPGGPTPAAWPPVVAVVPARDEGDVIGETLAALLAQDYRGPFSVVLVDDASSDGTARIARESARDSAFSDRLVVVEGAPPPGGWTGKLWALAQGVDRAAEIAPGAPFLWFTDADILHARGTLAALVAKAEAERRDLVSLMARLSCESALERLLIPAFVFFFQKLYPFPWVGDPGRRTAAAAGGCMLVRRAALERIGGIAAIRGALIDDCALARAIKAGGPVWLGHAAASRSIRRYRGLADVWDMVARTAYTQLRHSPGLLAATVAGMLLVYIAPPAVALAGAATGRWAAALSGCAAWTLMAVAYAPTLRLFDLSWRSAPALPAAALLYTLMTLDSARRHRLGRGGRWKGRTYGVR